MSFEFATRVRLPTDERKSAAAPAGFGQATAKAASSDAHNPSDGSHARAFCLAEQRSMHALEIVRLLDDVLGRVLRGFDLVQALAERAEREPDAAKNAELAPLLYEIGRVIDEARASASEPGNATFAIEIPLELHAPEQLERIEIALPDLQAILFDSDGFGDLDFRAPGAAANARALCESALREITDYRAALQNVCAQVERTLQGLAAARRPRTPEPGARRINAGLRSAARDALRAQSKLSARAVMLLETR